MKKEKEKSKKAASKLASYFAAKARMSASNVRSLFTGKTKEKRAMRNEI